ncbi:hypothetical protein FDV58_11950 [Bradyrhizobium elkanii]|uniref:Uncharacterized protein n=1 Tax=Bradyrhizobium elkanii TaxID=29448 RepID=A0A4U6SA09_BRAEL|nr:hypothetical protein [Bradyrhizobium sp. BR2003]TKV81576.1 hypothetical protein FDV58_11950 [Bradyrhizobium elkanii]
MEAAINVAESTDLMTNPGEMTDTIDVRAIKHICLVGNNRAPVQRARQPSSPRNGFAVVAGGAASAASRRMRPETGPHGSRRASRFSPCGSRVG